MFVLEPKYLRTSFTNVFDGGDCGDDGDDDDNGNDALSDYSDDDG